MGQRRSKKQLKKKRFRRRVRKFCGICLMLVLGLTAVTLFVKGGNYKSNRTAEQLAKEGYPESLINLLERNPEARDFVLDYSKNKERQQEIDLSNEVKKGEIPLFLQWDERWGYEFYGDDFLAVTGCGPTCLSMVCCGLSGDAEWNPYKVACMAEEQGYYVDGAGSSWELMSSGAQQLGLTVNNVSFDADHILSELNNGHPIICAMGPGDFTTSGHFIVLSGVDTNGKIIVRDPNSRKNSKKAWNIDDLMPQIRNLWSYSF